MKLIRDGILNLVPKLIPESFVRFLPAALAAVTDVGTGVFVAHHQPDYPGRFIVFQVVMFGAALLAAVPSKWVRFVGFVLLLAGVYISGMSVGVFYLPTFFTFVWVMVRDERPPVQSGPGRREQPQASKSSS